MDFRLNGNPGRCLPLRVVRRQKLFKSGHMHLACRPDMCVREEIKQGWTWASMLCSHTLRLGDPLGAAYLSKFVFLS